MANHNYIPHNGIATISQFIQGTYDGQFDILRADMQENTDVTQSLAWDLILELSWLFTAPSSMGISHLGPSEDHHLLVY